MSVRHAVIVTAAGSSRRFNAASSQAPVKKEFLTLNGKSILANAIEPFLAVKGLALVVVTYRKESFKETSDNLKTLELPDGVELLLVEGGETRQQSVFNALIKLDHINVTKQLDLQLVSIHDGARPFVKPQTIEACLKAAMKTGGAAPCVPISDTLVKAEKGIITGRVDRTKVYGVQTPQTFRYPDIFLAHVEAWHKSKEKDGLIYTDDTQIFTDYGYQVAIVEGDPKNKKITYPKDLENL